jgi:hypothetical protein
VTTHATTSWFKQMAKRTKGRRKYTTTMQNYWYFYFPNHVSIFEENIV